MLANTDHKHPQYSAMLLGDLKDFLLKNPHVACSIVSLNVDSSGKKNVFQVRGKLSIKNPNSGENV